MYALWCGQQDWNPSAQLHTDKELRVRHPKETAMSIYLVKNERNEEVAAYTDPQPAVYVAEQLQSATLQHYRVEELVVD